MANTIEIKITAENSQAIAALKQVADAANQVSSKTNAAGAESGDGFATSFNEIAATGKQVISVLQQISNAVNDLVSRFGSVGQSGAAAMEETTSAAKKASDAIGQESASVINAAQKETTAVKQIGQAATDTGEKIKKAGNGASFTSAKTSGEGFLGTLSKIGMAAFGLVETLKMVKETAGTVFGTGINYDRQLETARMGIAGILVSMTTWNGAQMQLNQAMKLSDQTLQQIQAKATQIGLKPQDMITAFQSILGPALQAKMTLEQIVNLTAIGTKAVKTMLGPQGNEMQVSQELRSMISGTIDQDSQVARAMGITNEGVTRAKQTAGGLFDYLKERLSGFNALAEEWPKSMTGAIERFEASYSQASGKAFESVFNSLKSTINELTDSLFVVDQKTKEVSFNPELLSDLKSLVSGTTELIGGTVQFSMTLAKISSGPASALLNILKFIFSNAQQVYLTIMAWLAIQKAVDIFRQIETQIIAVQKASLATGKAITGMEAATILLGKATKSVLITTGWGLLAVAIGKAADEAFKLYENLTNAGKAKRDYFKEKADAARPIPEQLEGKLQAPQYDVNPDVNMGGMSQDSILKLEKFISAVNYLYPDHHVTLTSGYRDWGGHVSGTKADIDIEGMKDPMFRNQLMELGKEFGIAILDEVDHPASDTEQARKNWGPHLDLNMAGSEEGNGSGLGLKNQPSTYDLDSKKVELAVQQIKNQADIDKAKIETQIAELTSKINADTVGADANRQLAELQLQLKQIDLDQMNATKASYNTLYASDTDKAHKHEIDQKIVSINTGPIQEQIDAATKSLQDMSAAIGALNGSWRNSANQINNFTNAITDIESSGGNYDALGPWVAYSDGSRDRALGKYQIMQSNWANWAEAAGIGREADWTNHDNQDAVANHMFNELFQKYGDWLKVAIAWHSGESHVNDSDAQLAKLSDGGMTTLEYKNRVASFMSNNAAQWGSSFAQYLPHLSNEVSAFLQKAQSVLSKMAEIDATIAEMQGNSIPKGYSDIDNKYAPYIKEFEANGAKEYLDKVYQIKQMEKNRVDFTQTQQNLERNNQEIVKSENSLLEDVASGAKTGADAIKEYADTYTSITKGTVDKIKSILEKAKNQNDLITIADIKTELAKIPAAINEFVDNAIQLETQRLQDQIDLINANPNLTSLEKSYQSDLLEKQIHRQNAASYRAQANVLDTIEGAAAWNALPQNAGKNIDLEKQALRSKAAIEEEKGAVLSLMDQVNNAGRQGLENGLVNFFEEGYKSCHKLIDAVRELAISILTEMNKVFSQDIARRLMSSIWPSSSNPSGSTQTATTDVSMSQFNTALNYGSSAFNQMTSIVGGTNSILSQLNNVLIQFSTSLSTAANVSSSNNVLSSNPHYDESVWGEFAEGGSLSKYADGGNMDSGQVKGPGTGASDSILAYLGNFKKFIGISDGEYVIRNAAVKRFGTAFFDKLNSGLIPEEFFKIKAKFADGGVVSGKTIAGVQDIAASLTSGDVSMPLKIINVSDPNEIGRYLRSKPGEQVLLNFMKNNSEVVHRFIKR